MSRSELQEFLNAEHKRIHSRLGLTKTASRCLFKRRIEKPVPAPALKPPRPLPRIKNGPPPENDLRVKILEDLITEAKTAYPNFEVPAEVVRYVARSLYTNRPNLDIAAISATRRLIKSQKILNIQTFVANHFNLSVSDILSHTRTVKGALPRQVAMYLSRKLTPSSFKEIGLRFAGRDHSTIIYAVRKIEEIRKSDGAIEDAIKQLTERVSEALK